MRSALESLQFVDKSKPIDTDVKSHKVRFAVTDKKQFDLDKVKEALKAKDMTEVKLVSGPS